MLSWLLIIILAYLFFALSSFGDKLFLSGPPNPKLYTFFLGVLNGLAILLIPFISFGVPSIAAFGWIILEAFVFIVGLYFMFSALEKFEVSKVIILIGALQPIFIFILTWIFFGPQPVKASYLLAFLLLILGIVKISDVKRLDIKGEYLKLVTISSLMFSFDYIFSKFVFLSMPFWQGLVWMRILIFLFALTILFDKNIRKKIFSGKKIITKKEGTIFVFTQTSGAIAGLLQSLAIALAPVYYLAIVNSLKGIQYAFLFLITLFCSIFFPRILKEKISGKIIIQKTIAILLIAGGIAVLFLF